LNIPYWHGDPMCQSSPQEAAELQMMNALAKLQMAVRSELHVIDDLVVDLSLRFGTKGLESPALREAMQAAVLQHPYLVSMITFDAKGVVKMAVPETHRFMQGVDLRASKNVAKMIATRMPVMSDVFKPRAGKDGAAISAPMFDAEGTFIGSVSTLFHVPDLMDAILPRGSDLTFTLMQLDGTIIYDTDKAQIGMNALKGEDYAAFPELQATARRMEAESSGHSYHSYFVDLEGKRVVKKSCRWTTVGIHGASWRLAIERQV
jgi:hypothetical protein